MSEVTKAQVIEFLSNMPVIEMSQLIANLEESWGVSAQPQIFGGGAPSTPGQDDLVEVQTEFEVILAEAGASKIQVIKVVRELTSLGLKEAKDKVDATPTTLFPAASKEQADEYKAKLEAAGAKVTLK